MRKKGPPQSRPLALRGEEGQGSERSFRHRRKRSGTGFAPTMCNWQGHLVRWLFGGVLYGVLEVLWRGHTHWTMMALAALLCVPLDVANEHMPWSLPLTVQAALGGLAITAGELAAGLILNVWLGLGVWDYTGQWGNLWGQVCPLYTALWCLLAGPVIVGFDWLDYWLCGGERPGYRRV